MKIRHPLLIKAVGIAGAWLLRSWMSTLRPRYRHLGPAINPFKPGCPRCIFPVWHENLLYPVHFFRRVDICYLIGQHADGQMLAEVSARLGVRLVRGSSTRGGEVALRAMIEAMSDSHLGITPDGPRGPRRVVHPGLLYVASQTGYPIVPTGLGFRSCWRLSSWDRMALPCPGTAATFVHGAPIHVPKDLNRPGLERYREVVQQSMDQVTRLAEEWAARGTWVESRAAA